MTDHLGQGTSAAGTLRFLQLREAIASVSLSHPTKCDCLTCRAGRGDEEALAQIVADLKGRPLGYWPTDPRLTPWAYERVREALRRERYGR